MASILVVDDDADIAENLAELLHAEGHEVRIASHGQEALGLLATKLPDLVLLDVEMPVLTGPEMAFRMLVHDRGPEEIPVVLVSGVLGLGSVAALVGTPYYFAKPFRVEAIRRLVNRALVERTRTAPPLRRARSRP